MCIRDRVNQECTQQDPTVATWAATASCVVSDDATYGMLIENDGGGANQGAAIAGQYTVTTAGQPLILSMLVKIVNTAKFRIFCYNVTLAIFEFGYNIEVGADDPLTPVTFTPIGAGYGETGYKVIYEGDDQYRINIYAETINASGDLNISINADRDNSGVPGTEVGLYFDKVSLTEGTQWPGYTASRGLSVFSIANHGLSPNSFAGTVDVQVDVVPESGVDQRLLWCGADTSNGIGLFLTPSTLTFRQRDAGVDTDATFDLGADIYPGTVLYIGYRKTATQLELYINGNLLATAATTTAATIGTAFALDASNCDVKELNLYNEV